MTGTTTWIDAWSPDEGEARARESFARAFAAPDPSGQSAIPAAPDGVWSAPGRVNLIGEHTDYNGGLSLPTALPHRTYVALRTRDDDVVRLVSADLPDQDQAAWTMRLADVTPGGVDGWGAYVAGVAWALREAGHGMSGFDATVSSCVPFGSGLSSSAALSCAAALALDATNDLGLAASDEGRAALVEATIRAEREIAGANTGGMDQTASLRARPGHALLLDSRDGAVRHVPWNPAAHGLALLVVDTRAPHAHVDGQYAERRATCEAAARALDVPTLREIADLPAALARLDDDVMRRRVRHVVTEIARTEQAVALLDSGDLAGVGPLMDASHDSLRDDYEVTCRELDLAVDTARASGAVGARMTGGGFGGSMIALVPVDLLDVVADAITAAFADSRLTAPAAVRLAPR